MMNLTLCEIKKILKNKWNFMILIIMTLFMLISTWEAYHEELPTAGINDEPIVVKTFEGKELKNMIELYRYADQILSKYEGKATKELWQTYYNDYLAYQKEFTKDYDDVRMKKVYGDDYLALFERVKHIEEDEYNEIINRYSENIYLYLDGSVNYHYQEDKKTGVLPMRYQKQGELNTLSFIYTGSFSNSFEQVQNTLPLYQKVYPQDTINSLMITDNEAHNNYLKHNFSKQQFFASDVTQIPLKKAFSRFSYLSSIAIAILLANSFAIENHTKMDQILVPSREGFLRISIAKIFAGLSVALLSILLQIAAIFIVAYLLLPPSGWDVTQINSLNMSNLSYMLSTIQILLIGTLSISILTLFLSSITKNQFVTIIISFLIIIVPFMIELNPTLSKTLPCFFMYPDSFLTYYTLTGSSPVVSFMNHTLLWKDVSTILWIILSIILSGGILLHAKFIKVKNK